MSDHECVGTDGASVLCLDGWIYRVCRHPKCDGVPHRIRVCLCACHGGV